MTGGRQRFTPLAAPAALADGGLHPGDAVHRRRHGVHHHANYLTLVSIHKPLGIAILVLALIRLAVRLRSAHRRCRPTCRSR